LHEGARRYGRTNSPRFTVQLDALDGERITVLMDAIEGLVAAPTDQA